MIYQGKINDIMAGQRQRGFSVHNQCGQTPTSFSLFHSCSYRAGSGKLGHVLTPWRLLMWLRCTLFLNHKGPIEIGRWLFLSNWVRVEFPVGPKRVGIQKISFWGRFKWKNINARSLQRCWALPKGIRLLCLRCPLTNLASPAFLLLTNAKKTVLLFLVVPRG